jgi:hypothetical protein
MEPCICEGWIVHSKVYVPVLNAPVVNEPEDMVEEFPGLVGPVRKVTL